MSSFSSQIKYNAPLPGDEYRSRELTVPAEAVKVLFEIDFSFSAERELCLTVLEKVFRGTDRVTQILQDCESVLHRGGKGVAPWKHEAAIQRRIKATQKRN